MKKNILKKAGIGIGLALLVLPVFTLNATVHDVTKILIEKPSDINRIIENVLAWIGGIVLIIALIMLLWAAILYLTAGGSEDRATRAKNYLIYAIVGIVIAILAFSVAPFLTTFFGWR